MSWRHKALLQLALSHFPLGERLNYFFQRFVTRSLPTTTAKFTEIVSIAKEHIDIVRQYYGRPLGEATFYEFGAGWDMIVPLALYSFGVERQIVVDIRKLLRPTIMKCQRIPLDGATLRKPSKYIDDGQYDLPALLKKNYGLEYRAPCDARHTGLKAGSIDCITSTNTLEHIPVRDIQAILQECHYLLQDDGLMSFRIDYQDHYSYFDKDISVYNFLQYSDKAWMLFSPKLHYQNRLRHRDYLKLLESAGFEILEERRKDGTNADLETIERLPLDKRFSGYSFPIWPSEAPPSSLVSGTIAIGWPEHNQSIVSRTGAIDVAAWRERLTFFDAC